MVVQINGLVLLLENQKTFFISRSSADKAFGSWLAKEIRQDGHRTIVQNENFGHQAFMKAMHDTVITDPYVVAIYSSSYFGSEFCLKEALSPLNRDPFNNNGKLIPLTLTKTLPPGMLDGIPPVDIYSEVQSNEPQKVYSQIRTALRIEGDLRRCSDFNPEIVSQYAFGLTHSRSLEKVKQKMLGYQLLKDELGEEIPAEVRNEYLQKILTDYSNDVDSQK